MTLASIRRLPGWSVTIAEITENARYLAVVEAVFQRLALIELPEMEVLNVSMIAGAPIDIETDASGQRIHAVTNNAVFWVYTVAEGTFDTLELPLQPRRFALRPLERNEAWIVAGTCNSILIIDLPQLSHLDTVVLPLIPTDIQFSRDGQFYFVSMMGDSGVIAQYNAVSRQLVQSKRVGIGAFDLAVSEDCHYAAVSDSTLRKIHVWDTFSGSVWSLQVDGNPFRIRFQKRSHTFYVLLIDRNRILRISMTDDGPIINDALVFPPTVLDFVLWE